MTLYIGHILAFFSIITNFINLFIYYINVKKNSSLLQKIFILFSRLNFIFISLAFVSLIYLYINSDFRNLNVFLNSHSAKPLIYKISGTWGNHEGSLLMWILIMSTYTFIFSFNRTLNIKLINLTIFFQTIMTICFLIFMILTSNPFIANSTNIKEGMGLNPILQDPALAIHPPLLYLGYVGFSLVLSLAVAGLITDKIEKAWIKTVKKYSLFCWAMLTLGIAAGSFWAYYELGWGGWWFWDPVENASLMPWLSGLALIHSLQVIYKSSHLKRWVIFLSILCFSLSLLGTFLVRSGVLMSVHAFANDSFKGIFILMLFFIITGFSFLVFIIKPVKTIGTNSIFYFNKFSSLIINNIIMTVACFTVLLGTIYPIILESITNERISVGAPYFNSTVLPILLPGLLVMAIAPALSWKENKSKKTANYFTLFLIIILFLIVIYILSNINPWGIIGLGLGIWIISASFIQLYKNNLLYKIKKENFINLLRSNSSLISHLGVGLLIIGITFSSVWKKEFIESVVVGDVMKIHNYSLKLNSIIETKKQNYTSVSGIFLLEQEGKKIDKIIAEKRYYPVSKIITTEAGILHQIWQDIYVVLDDNTSNKWQVKVYHNPLVSLIWIGAIIISIGGLFAIRKI